MPPADPKPELNSPLPDEPDVHIQFVDIRVEGEPFVIADYRMCATAAANLARDWSRSHSPHMDLRVIHDQFACPRMKYEELWIIQR